MKKVYFAADNIISSLGFDTDENIKRLQCGESGISLIYNTAISRSPVCASVVDNIKLESHFSGIIPKMNHTRLEKMYILSINRVIEESGLDPANRSALLIISTTKGNIDLLAAGNEEGLDGKRIYLWELAKTIAGHFGFANAPLVVSNACISGSAAVILAARLIGNGEYENIIVSGADLITEFVVSGFQSFQAICPEPCRPFDEKHCGISLGEGCGTILLTSNPESVGSKESVIYAGGSISNDANHISGPSRTGEGLFLAINKCLGEAGFAADTIDYISAHGTATVYNDNMEAKAFARCGLATSPANSIKGSIGHTLGAAGVIEIAAMLASMRDNKIYKSAGFDKIGTEDKINIADRTISRELVRCLKTSSGFGGCNAALAVMKA